jgi:VWFA-related protein
MSRLTVAIAALVVAVGSLGIGAGRQGRAARIVSPADGTYLNGPVRLVIAFEPIGLISQVRQVRWFADTRQVCTTELLPFSCEWDAGELVKAHVIRAVAVLKDGQQVIANARTKAVDVAEAVDVDVLQVTAVVTDGDGRFVSGLRAGDFKLYEDDTLEPLTQFGAEDIPLELVAAIDSSSSMTDVLPSVRRHATHFLSQLRPEDQATVLGFNENIITLARRSTDQDVRAKAIARLRPWGGTALYDVLIQSLELLGRQAGRRSLLVFSDGDDQNSHASMATAIQRAEASDATIYIIGQGSALHAPGLQELMRKLASVSGGRAFFSDQDDKLERIFQEVLEDLRHQYVLSYAAPDNARNGEWHRIRVEVPGHHYGVRARLGYRIPRRVPQ